MKKICDMRLEEFQALKKSGLFWEFYPEASGDFHKDRESSAKGKFKIENG